MIGNSVVNISLDAKFLGLGVPSKWSRCSFEMVSEFLRDDIGMPSELQSVEMGC